MSQAEELLNGMTDAEPAETTADVNTEPHIVIGTDKFITVPPELRKIAVQHEHNVKTVTFDCPRYWDGRDLMDMVICVNYKTPNNVVGQKEVENVAVDPTDDAMIHFDWVITKNVTQANGTLSFLVCGIKLDDNAMEDQHWNSELNRDMVISEGLECAKSILEAYPDVITDILVRLRRVEAGDVTLDGTLTMSGYAADAKAVGDALDNQKLLVVTLNEYTQTASHSGTEIIDHLAGGGSVVSKLSGTTDKYGHLQAVADGEVAFFHTMADGASTTQYIYTVKADKSYTVMELVIESGSGGAVTDEQVSVVSVSTVRSEQTITMTLILSDNTAEAHVITLDDNDYPTSITVNGTAIPIEWSGF